MRGGGTQALGLKGPKGPKGPKVLPPSKRSCEVSFDFGKSRPLQDAVLETNFRSEMVRILAALVGGPSLVAMVSRDVNWCKNHSFPFFSTLFTKVHRDVVFSCKLCFLPDLVSIRGPNTQN